MKYVFPMFIILKMQTKKQSQSTSCSICIERPSTASVNGCFHRFCLKCIRRWSKTKNTCPLCRQRFLEIINGKRHYKVNPPKVVAKNSISSQGGRRIVSRRVIYFPIIVNTMPMVYFLNQNDLNQQNSDSNQPLVSPAWSYFHCHTNQQTNSFFLPQS